MSGAGAPQVEMPDARGLRVGVVAALWHGEIMDAMLAGALRALSAARVDEPTVIRVPGAFELPVVSQRLAASGHQALVALAVVIRGGTPHFDYVCQGVTAGLTQVAVGTGIPVGFGVLTCDDEDQARARAGLPGSQEDKGYDAALAAVHTAVALRDLRHGLR